MSVSFSNCYDLNFEFVLTDVGGAGYVGAGGGGSSGHVSSGRNDESGSSPSVSKTE